MTGPHIVDGDGRPLCPEAEFRAALSDGEFWEYSLNGVKPGDPRPDAEIEFDERDVTAQFDPCPLCGERGACGHDDEGRPMIHTTDEDEVAP